MSKDIVEYYDGDNLYITVISSIVPPVGSKINIRKKTWKIINVTYAVDFADSVDLRHARVNVDIEAVE